MELWLSDGRSVCSVPVVVSCKWFVAPLPRAQKKNQLEAKEGETEGREHSFIRDAIKISRTASATLEGHFVI